MCFVSPNTDGLTPLRSQSTTDRAPDHSSMDRRLRSAMISLPSRGPTAVRARVTDVAPRPRAVAAARDSLKGDRGGIGQNE